MELHILVEVAMKELQSGNHLFQAFFAQFWGMASKHTDSIDSS